MDISRTRVRTLLLGTDTHLSRWGIGGAVGLFVGVFAALLLWPDPIYSLWSTIFPLPSLTIVVAAGVFVYYNEGVIVALLSTLLPAYAYMIHLLHEGNIRPHPYPEAAIMALPWGLAIGGLFGLLGVLLGFGARRLT